MTFWKAWLKDVLFRQRGLAPFYKILMPYDGLRHAEYLRHHYGFEIGENTTINRGADFMDLWGPNRVTIGRDCSISACKFITHSGYDRVINHVYGTAVDSGAPITIGNRVGIGMGASIAYGVTIGDDCIIGFDTAVRTNIPCDSLVIGNPGVIVGRTSDYIASLIARSEAGRRGPDRLKGLDDAGPDRPVHPVREARVAERLLPRELAASGRPARVNRAFADTE